MCFFQRSDTGRSLSKWLLSANRLGNKIAVQKALIPLPPTRFVSLFIANHWMVLSDLQPRPALGPLTRVAIAHTAKFCSGMSWARTMCRMSSKAIVLRYTRPTWAENRKIVETRIFHSKHGSETPEQELVLLSRQKSGTPWCTWFVVSRSAVAVCMGLHLP